MKTIIFARRNLKEMLNDILSLFFMIVLPAFLLVLMVTLNKNIGLNETFAVENFVPSIIIFSFPFSAMFSGVLVSRDRSNSFLARLFVSPLKAHHYIVGYMLPLLIISFIQIIFLYIVGIILGLKISIYIIVSLPFLVLISFLFVNVGLLFGSTLKEQQVGGVSSIFIQFVAFLGGVWFPLEIVGGAFEIAGKILPFYHCIQLAQKTLAGNFQNVLLHTAIIIGYTILVALLAIFSFKKKMIE